MAVLAGAAAIGAPSTLLAVPVTSVPMTFAEETKLRLIERTTLGEAHAAEHAAQRAHARALTLAKRAAKKKAVARKRPRALRVKRPHALSDDGQWGSPFPIPVMGINAVLLPTGKVLYFTYPQNPNPLYNPNPNATPNVSLAYVWDPSLGTSSAAFRSVPPPIDPSTGQPWNLWCAGQTLLADGRVIVAGGNLAYEGKPGNPGAFRGLDQVFTFDPFTETWQLQPKMNDGRWYPTLVRLADGRVLITGGLDKTGDYLSPYNRDIEIFTPSVTPGALGTTTMVGKRANNTTGGAEPPNGGLYPHQYLAPSGRVVTLGPNVEDSWAFTNPGNTMAWSDLANLPARRMWAMSVLLPGGLQGSSQVLMMGGSDTTVSDSNAPATRTTMAIDITAPAPSAWTPASQMAVGRGHGNSVILPDGSILAVGGGYGAAPRTTDANGTTIPVQGDLWAAGPEHKAAEIRDPGTGAWRSVAAQAENRAYHSTALLMPDGRVISAGDDGNGGYNQDTAEIYAPPYLFKGPRPVIDSVPASIRYGATIRVRATGSIAKAVLIAPGATTHAVDMNQRSVAVAMTQTATGVNITTPTNLNVAPPGYYMLFLLSPEGVPSVARFVRLDPNAPEQPADPPTGQPPGTAPVPPVLAPAGPAQPHRAPPPLRRLRSLGVKLRVWAPATVRLGKSFAVSVRLSGSVPRSKAVLQRRFGTRYQTLATKSFAGKSVVMRLKLARPGTAVLRVVVGRAGVASSTGSVRVKLVK